MVKKIEKVIEKIPGLGPMIEELMNTIAVLVFTTLEVSHAFHSYFRFQTDFVQPYLKPLMQTATKQLSTASGDVIKGHDQEECFRCWFSYLFAPEIMLKPSTTGIPTPATRPTHI